MSYILGFDIGNTNTTLGIYCKSDISPVKTFRFRTKREILSDELGLLINHYIITYKDEIKEDISIEGVAISSVVSEVKKQYNEISKSLFNVSPLEINYKVKLGINIRYENPDQLGADRLVNAVAAFNEYRSDCIIIDLGTATTFCVLDRDGVFNGGLICPGIEITIDALADKASKLVKINFERPKNLVAKNTVDAIKSGFFYGWLSMVEGIIDRIERQCRKEFLLIITGGYSEVIGENIKRKNIVDTILTMKGIKYIYDLNY